MNPIYQFTVPVFAKSLKALDGLLTKAEQAIASGKLTEEALMNDRLAPDMFPFVKQVQVACDNAKGACARLSGSEIASHPDEEKTLAELHARIAKTLEIVNATTEESFADAATRQITISYFPGKYMTGFDYAREYAIPNFYFHVTTAYDILRKLGLEIGKADFMGGLPFNELA
jgi:hypothetical protein